ncbi:MAG: SDR family NAD(P)-dependent oxidoreductase [Clostridia bacterium]|nr:SDR family NAD(P)-dependent oxidoreductase [Clostridia bacterium]
MKNIGNNKRIAILTGATGGLGYAFLRELIKEPLDEIWAFGRNRERLETLVNEFGNIIVPVCKDLTDTEDLTSIVKILEEQKPRVEFLINNAGLAQMKASKDFTVAEIGKTIDLNCKAPVILINGCLPYMARGSKILNICSASAFQPVPYINLYASTKAFERSYSRALNVELKPFGISVTAVCPSWIDTDMLTKEINGKKVKFSGIVSPQRVAEKAMKDAKKGRDMSVCSFYVKCQHFNVKLMPQKSAMRIWMKNIKKYL